MERVITRTIKSYEVEVLCLDIQSKETFTQKETVTQLFKSEERLLSYLKSKIDTDLVKALAIVEISEVSEQMYGMKEVDFLNHAKVITSRREV